MKLSTAPGALRHANQRVINSASPVKDIYQVARKSEDKSVSPCQQDYSVVSPVT